MSIITSVSVCVCQCCFETQFRVESEQMKTFHNSRVSPIRFCLFTRTQNHGSEYKRAKVKYNLFAHVCGRRSALVHTAFVTIHEFEQ